jgi:HEAT repeat protein
MAEELLEAKQDLGENGEIPSFEGEETTQPVLEARDLMNIFVKTIKAFRIYPPENPSLIGFRDLLFRRFQDFLKKYHSFIFQIGEYEFAFQGRVLYENTDLKTSLAFLLYKDGLREIRFMEGLAEWEIHELIDIIKRVDHINQLEDDIVTLLWEKDFLHISYLATDEYLEEIPILIPENVEQFRKNLRFEPLGHQVGVNFRDEDTGEEVDYAALAQKLGAPPPLATNRNVYFLVPDEIESLRREVEEEVSPIFLFNITDILFEILAMEKRQEPYQEAAGVLEKLLDALITVGDFRRSSDLLGRIRIALTTQDLEDWQEEILRNLVEKAGDPQRIERLGKILEKRDGVQMEDAARYLKLLKANSIPSLMVVLGELSNPKGRRIICDALCEIGKDQIEVISPFLEDRRWYLVRNVAYILGRIGKDKAFPALQKTFRHPEARVRRETVQALGLIGGVSAFSQLRKFLLDPDARVRSLAALSLARVGKKASIAILLRMIQSKEFKKRDPGEMKAFFDAIGMAGSQEAIPILEKLLFKRVWFGQKGQDGIRRGAANALSLIGSREARKILESGKTSRNTGIRKACLQALRRQSS